MSRRASPVMIGAFIVGALGLVVVGLLVFGSGKFFTKRARAVMYFEGDVKGLRVGAPLSFRGVPIGSVTNIKAVFDAEEARFRIPVMVEFVEKMVETKQMSAKTPRQTLEILVDRGLRAQLQAESLVTGRLFVQLDFFPKAPPRKVGIDPETKLVEIPTIPSTLQQMTETVMKAVNRISELPIEELVAGMEQSLTSINRLVNAPETKESIRNLNEALIEVRRAAQRIEKQVDPIATQTTQTLQSVQKWTVETDRKMDALTLSFKETATAAKSALEQTEKAMASVEGLSASGSPVRYEMLKTLRELSDAARSLRALSDFLEQQPDSVIFGRKDRR